MKVVLATALAPHNRRVDFAMSTWTNAEVVEVECERTSKELGDERGCYFFKDVFDYALSLAPDDIFVYANNDVALVPEWAEIIIPSVQARGNTESSRVEVAKFEERLCLSQIQGGATHGGKDIFAFFPTWWKQVRESLPDLLLGYEGYDFVVSKTMQQTGNEIVPICYHETHHPFWRTITSDHPARIRERALLQKWITEKRQEGWQFGYRPYGAFTAGESAPNLSTSAGKQRKNLSTSAELFQ